MRALALPLLILAAPLAAEPLDWATVEAQLLDRRLEFTGQQRGKPVAGLVIYHKAGQMTVIDRTGKKDRGIWKQQGNRLCTRITSEANAREICFAVEQSEAGYTTSHGLTLTPVNGG